MAQQLSARAAVGGRVLRRVSAQRGGGPAGTAAGHDARAAQVPLHGARRRGPHRDRRRRPRRSQHLLPRLRVGRRVEVDRRRPDVRADLRRPARRRDRRHRRRRQRSQHRLGRHRRVVGHPLQRRHGRRRLRLEGRRQDLEEHGPEGDRPHLARHHPSDRPQHRLRLRDRPPDRTAGRARRVQDDRRRRQLAARATSWTRNTGCSGLSMDAKDPNILLAGTGRSSSTPGCSAAADRAAAST